MLLRLGHRKAPILVDQFLAWLRVTLVTVSHCVEEISVALLVDEVRVSHGLS
jgi:hypothetical protein